MSDTLQRTSVVGVLCDGDTTQYIANGVVLGLFQVHFYKTKGVVYTDVQHTDEMVLVGYLNGQFHVVCCLILLEPEPDSIFPIYRPSRSLLQSRRRQWWLDLMYVDGICGVSQIVRFPTIPVGQVPTIDDYYIGMPYTGGNPNYEAKPIQLKKLGPEERELASMSSDLDCEVV